MASTFSQQVKAHRRRRGLAQSDVAMLLGDRSAARVSRYERGRRLPSLLIALTYEAIFQTKVSELFCKQYAAVIRDVKRRAKRLASSGQPRNAALAEQRKRSIDKLLAR